VRTYRRMLRKNLLYTAITRSKQSLILCGELDAFMQGIATVDTNVRYTTLPQYLRAKLTDEPSAQQEESIIEEKKDEDEPFDENHLAEPVHVDDFTPYDFL